MVASDLKRKPLKRLLLINEDVTVEYQGKPRRKLRRKQEKQTKRQDFHWEPAATSGKRVKNPKMDTVPPIM
jgi:hypothetical protein